MKNLLMAIICFATAIPMAIAQQEPATMPKEKKFDHNLGFQVNGLVRQVLNFGGNNNANNNPYLVIYSINKIKSGWGLRLGAGYNNRSFAENDGIVETESDINAMQVRLGVEKRFQLSPKWTTGVGIDGIYHNDENITRTVTRAFDTSIVKSNTAETSYGGGAMAWLRYNITDKILIGTEASFYYRFGTQKLNITITERENVFPGGSMVTTITKKEHDLTEGVINLPIALYLIIKF